MIGDFNRITAATGEFAARIADLAKQVNGVNVSELEQPIAMQVASLANAFGWTDGVRVSLRSPPDINSPPSPIRQFIGAFGRAADGALTIALDPDHYTTPGILPMVMRRLPVLLWLFGSVFQRAPASRDYVCALGDGSQQPIVAFAASRPDACRVPDCEFFATAGYRDFKAAIARDCPAWETRTAKIFWRGSSSGLKRYWPPAGPQDTRWLPRVDFCARARASRHAERFDVGITQWVQIPDRERSLALLPQSLTAAPVPKEAFARFKAVIDIDGNSNSWSGLFMSLLCGSCVVKIASERGFSQWYYDRMTPWVHYVPVRSDLSDLEAAVDWIFADDGRARAIGEAGRALAHGLDFETEMTAAVDRLIAWGRTR